jgi:hypothetical protein
MLMQVQREVDAGLERWGFGLRDVDAGSERY